MADRDRITLEQLKTELPRIISHAARHNADILADNIQEWPNRFVRRSKQFYPSVLKRPTGTLWRSMSALVRRLGETMFLVGERSNVDYAAPLEHGFHGDVTVPTHLVRRHRVRSHVNRAGTRIKEHSRGPFTREGHTRRMNIEARYFFKIPILRETEDAMNDLANEIGWPP